MVDELMDNLTAKFAVVSAEIYAKSKFGCTLLINYVADLAKWTTCLAGSTNSKLQSMLPQLPPPTIKLRDGAVPHSTYYILGPWYFAL